MALRVRLSGIETNVIKTISSCMLLDARAMRRSMPEESLNRNFPKGSGIDFNLQDGKKVTLRSEAQVIAHLDGVPMIPDHYYEILPEHTKILAIGEELFRASVFHSDF